MILRFAENIPISQLTGSPRSASEVFLDTQQRPAEGCEFVFQAEHSALAGELVAHLLPNHFGELPNEVREAAARHDLGWAESDARQLAEQRETRPKPFPAAPEDELASWRRSLHLAEGFSPLTYVLISRHFAALSNRPAPRHQEYLDTETPRRESAEHSLPYSPDQLKQWTAAVGFVTCCPCTSAAGRERPRVSRSRIQPIPMPTPVRMSISVGRGSDWSSPHLCLQKAHASPQSPISCRTAPYCRPCAGWNGG